MAVKSLVALGQGLIKVCILRWVYSATGTEVQWWPITNLEMSNLELEPDLALLVGAAGSLDIPPDHLNAKVVLKSTAITHQSSSRNLSVTAKEKAARKGKTREEIILASEVAAVAAVDEAVVMNAAAAEKDPIHLLKERDVAAVCHAKISTRKTGIANGVQTADLIM